MGRRTEIRAAIYSALRSLDKDITKLSFSIEDAVDTLEDGVTSDLSAAEIDRIVKRYVSKKLTSNEEDDIKKIHHNTGSAADS